MEDIATLISVENRGKHFYTIETDFSKGVNLKKYPNSKTEPRLRPTVVGERLVLRLETFLFVVKIIQSIKVLEHLTRAVSNGRSNEDGIHG